MHTYACACTYAHAHTYVQAQACRHVHTCAHTRGQPTHAVCAHSRGKEDVLAEEPPLACPLCCHHITSLAGSRKGQWSVHTPVHPIRVGRLPHSQDNSRLLPNPPEEGEASDFLCSTLVLLPPPFRLPHPLPPAANSGSVGESGTRNKLLGASLLQPLGRVHPVQSLQHRLALACHAEASLWAHPGHLRLPASQLCLCLPAWRSWEAQGLVVIPLQDGSAGWQREAGRRRVLWVKVPLMSCSASTCVQILPSLLLTINTQQEGREATNPNCLK